MASDERREPITLRLFSEYQIAFPLWGPQSMGYNIMEDQLPISGELRDRLLVWSDEFNDIFDPNDPGSARFPSKAAARKFVAEGEQLAEMLRNELGEGWIIEYVIGAMVGPEELL